MARETKHNKIVTPELLAKVSTENTELMNDFLEYLASIDRSELTILNYRSDLQIFFVYNMLHNNNTYFVNLTKRQIAKFQNYCLNELEWSSNRMRRVKSAISSLSNYIENILDDEIEGYRSIVRKIENPVKEEVREKTVLNGEEVKFLLDTLVEKGKIQQACVIALACYSGSRKRELTRFKISFFDDENIILDGAMYMTPEKIKTKGRGNKLGKPLNKYALIEFKKYLDLWLEKRKELGIDSEWLFVSKESGKYIQAKPSLFDSYAQTATKILDKHFYFHCMRHYLCTLLNEKKIPSNVIQEFFGWTSEQMVSLYNDKNASDSFGDYFTKDGIQEGKQGSLSDI